MNNYNKNKNKWNLKRYLLLFAICVFMIGETPYSAWAMLPADDFTISSDDMPPKNEGFEEENLDEISSVDETDNIDDTDTETSDLESSNESPAMDVEQPDIPDVTKSYVNGQITINGVIYQCNTNGEATILNGKSATGDFIVPKEIPGLGNENYLVTRIEGYTAEGIYKGAFQGGKITGLSFEDGSSLKYIGDHAFSACYGLTGKSVQIPDSVTYIGKEAFYLFYEDTGLGELRHPQRVQVIGELPALSNDETLSVPPEATAYESYVDSSQDNVTLHKSSSWTNNDLTEAEIRIDYGKLPTKNAKMDFVFVLDQSNSMLDITQATDENGNTYEYPRSLFTNDIVYGISKILLDNAPAGYDNRVALTAFGTSDYGIPLWNLDFTDSSTTVQEALFTNPTSLANNTNYNAGLQGAIDLITNREDKSRTPVVIFLSDGLPTSGNNGTSQAQQLRNMGAKVYPLAIYTKPNSSLINISHDKATAYDASDTESFRSIIVHVMEEIIEQDDSLDINLEDVISEYFELATGTNADIIVPEGSGTVTLNGDSLIWDLSGMELNKVHNIKIKVKLKSGSELSSTGTLPTNTSLAATDGSISATAQPQLSRYLVHHAFRNGTNPDQPLPPEIIALLPGSKGGYRTQAKVLPTDLSSLEVITSDGDRWIFEGWDSESATIALDDITFTGVWINTATSFSFTKTDEAGIGISGVAFELYQWNGESLPTDADSYITESNTSETKWVKTNLDSIVSGSSGEVVLNFQKPGLYQLIEVIPPTDYYAPDSQWRITIDQNGNLTDIVTIKKDDTSVNIVDFEKTINQGIDTWSLKNYRKTEFSFRKISSIYNMDEPSTVVTLDGAEFELYLWKGAAPPSDTDLVTADTIQQGLWLLVDTSISKEGGKVNFTIPAGSSFHYQLVEKNAPKHYYLPAGQWRIIFAGNGDVSSILEIPGEDGVKPPAIKKMEDGQFAGQMVLANVPIYELPTMGGTGKRFFLITGMVLIITVLIWQLLSLHHNKQNN